MYNVVKFLKNLINLWFQNYIPITVVITTYNQDSNQIDTCLNSIMRQTIAKFKILIVDDGSSSAETINYLTRIEQKFDPRILVDFQIHRGVIGARNYAIKTCTSKYIVFIDPDDSIESTFLEKSYLIAESYKGSNLALVHSDVLITGDQNFIWETSELLYEKLLNQNTIPICSLIRRRVLKKVGGFSTYMGDGYEDWECWIKIAKYGYRSFRIPEPLFKYKFSSQSGRDYAARQSHDALYGKIRFANSKGMWRLRSLARARLRLNVLDYSFYLPRNKKRPVIFFVPWLIKDGGAENFLKTLARGLDRNGRNVVFVATNNEVSSGFNDFVEITPYIYDLSKFLTKEDYLKFVNNLLGRFSNPIVINCGSAWLYENLVLLRKFQNKELTTYDILFNSVGHFRNFVSNQDLFNYVIPVYKSLESLLLDELNEGSRVKVKRIPVGINPLRVTERKLPHDLVQIGWIGRISQEKRPDLFINLARDSKIMATFNLAGTGPLLSEMLERSRNISNVNLLGRIESSLEFLDSIDLLINTSSIEGIPLTLMEAVSLGVPVIAPNIGGISELIIDGKNGYLFDANDYRSLLLIIQNVVNTPGELARLQKSTKEMGLPVEFHAEIMISSFESILD